MNKQENVKKFEELLSQVDREGMPRQARAKGATSRRLSRMEFNIFQPLCPFSGLAYAYQDDHTRMEMVCHRDDRRPDGHSWSICNEEHCPYFGTRIVGSNVTIYNSYGVELGCESIETTAILPPEDYE